MFPFLAPHLLTWIDVAIIIIPMILPWERYYSSRNQQCKSLDIIIQAKQQYNVLDMQ